MLTGKSNEGELGEITSTHNNIDNYNTLSKLNSSFVVNLGDGVYDNLLDKAKTGADLRINPLLYKEETKNILLWKLKVIPNILNISLIILFEKMKNMLI